MRHGNLFVISGPSGAGKGTLVARVLQEVPDSYLSVSATTRNPREGEVNGKHYYFISSEKFDELAEKGDFLEWARYTKASYGTPYAPVAENMEAGKQVILEIDVQGADQVRKRIPQAHFVFIEPPSFEELEQRLRGRGTEDDATIHQRLEAAKVELSRKEEYDIQLVNDDLDEAVDRLIAYINEKAEETRG